MIGTFIKQSRFMLLIIVLCGSIFGGSSAHGQDYNNKNYIYYPVFIYNFCKYIQWPGQGNEIIIAVMGNSPIIPQLQRMATAKSTPTMKFVIKKFDTVEDINACHVLFMPNTYGEDVKNVYKKLEGKSVLFITENEKYIRKYSCINFISVKGKPLFQLNRSQMSKANLKVSSKLLSLAIIVRE